MRPTLVSTVGHYDKWIILIPTWNTRWRKTAFVLLSLRETALKEQLSVIFMTKQLQNQKIILFTVFMQLTGMQFSLFLTYKQTIREVSQRLFEVNVSLSIYPLQTSFHHTCSGQNNKKILLNEVCASKEHANILVIKFLPLGVKEITLVLHKHSISPYAGTYNSIEQFWYLSMSNTLKQCYCNCRNEQFLS